jgi:dethiobiotin synthetase
VCGIEAKHFIDGNFAACVLAPLILNSAVIPGQNEQSMFGDPCCGLKRSIYFITGTDTGVGKTLTACLLVEYLQANGARVAALKPVCSGGRNDAHQLHACLRGALTLDEINPWHFRAALAPVVAACREHRTLKLAQVLKHVRNIQRMFPTMIVEGAGGLLSPLGEDFDSRDLIERLGAIPVVVCPNRLGAINHSRLVFDAFSRRCSDSGRIVLMSSRKSDAASRSNVEFLRETFGRARVHVLPWMNRAHEFGGALQNANIRRTIEAVLKV